MTSARPLRADAVRNRKKILNAAREQIAAHGPDIGMDEIATAAGVAVGTLYRHFPAKTDLVAAVIADWLERVADDAEAAAARTTAGSRALDEIAAFLQHFLETAANDMAVKAAARTIGADTDPDTPVQRVTTALNTLIHAGQAEGDIHPDVTLADFYLLLDNAPTNQTPEATARWLTLLLPGLTTQGRPDTTA
ncbi:TetR family transcriptional regulator [Streptomyces spiralis]|uniref:TetR family transcriptional regulator n=1 Tax=Streptomyces spiralis TaxID=66376 RepID=A0A919ABX9_9ACTN|nr:TetR/AcrR family transcriptional regulator [Streptomyces spiralis]GHE98940.1 TetR family transcriptional regulator [Streptomyces spiralis]